MGRPSGIYVGAEERTRWRAPIMLFFVFVLLGLVALAWYLLA